MLELNDPFDCFVKGLGECIALYIISGGSIHGNPQFMVRIHDSGDLRVVDMRDIRTYGNPSAGQPLVPDGIKEWKNESKPKVKECETDINSIIPDIVIDDKNECIKIIGDHTLYDLYNKLLKLYIDVKYDKWTVSGQHETYINLPKCNSISSTYYRIVPECAK